MNHISAAKRPIGRVGFWTIQWSPLKICFLRFDETKFSIEQELTLLFVIPEMKTIPYLN